MGFVSSKSNSSLFIQKGPEGPMCILLYVDDLVITNLDLVAIIKVKSQLSEAFDMKDLGDLYYFLGTEVIHTPSAYYCLGDAMF